MDEDAQFKFTSFFEDEVLRKRPILTKEMGVRVIQSPLHIEPQEYNGFRFWAAVPELQGRYLRVVTLADQR